MMKMRICLSDRSIYLKGFMLLIKKDREIHDAEKTVVMHLGANLGFDKKFCENTIRDIMSNQHIGDGPLTFSDPGVARCFIRDGIRLSLVDSQADEREIAWLRKVARVNGLGERFFADALTAVFDAVRAGTDARLDAAFLEWE
jgi:hypothetical protein